MIPEEQKTTMVGKVKEYLKEMLDASPDFAGIREVKAVVDFYGKAKEGEIEPAQALALINQHLVDNLADEFVKELSHTLEEKLENVTLSFDKDGVGVSYSFPDVSVAVDFDLYANEMRLVTVTIGATLESEFAIAGAKKTQASIKIDEVGVDADLFLFTKMMLGKKKKQIASKTFSIENVEMNL